MISDDRGSGSSLSWTTIPTKWLSQVHDALSCSSLAQVRTVHPSPRSKFKSLTGTNLQALIDAQGTHALHNAQIVLVLSNRKAAYGLTRAQQAQPPIPTAYLALQPFLKANPAKTREDYDAEVAKIVVQAKPDLVVLAGWMTSVFASPTFARLLASFRLSTSFEPVAASPLTPKLSMPPYSPGTRSSFFASSCEECDSRPR